MSKEEPELPFLVDAHCHLQDTVFRGKLEKVLQRAHYHGIHKLACCGTQPSDWDVVLNLHETHSSIIPGLAWHPWYINENTFPQCIEMTTVASLASVKEEPDWKKELESKLRIHPHSYIGECGLDGSIKFRKYLDLQEHVLRHHILLAETLQRPLAVHCVKAWERLYRVLDEFLDSRNSRPNPLRIQLHSFSGSKEELQRLLRWESNQGNQPSVEFFFSLSGSITCPKNRKIREAIPMIPIHRLLIESDAPNTPSAHQPSTMMDHQTLGMASSCEPSYIIHHTLKSVSELIGVRQDRLVEILYDNSRHFFGSTWNGRCIDP